MTKKFLMHGFIKRNISSTNQLLRANYANFNLIDQIKHLGGVVTPTHADDDAYAVGPGSWAGLRASAAVRVDPCHAAIQWEGTQGVPGIIAALAPCFGSNHQRQEHPP